MGITQDFLAQTRRLQVSPEVTPGDHGFSMFNDAGTEVEVSEFIYSLVRILKPHFVLETGTHRGVSASYIARALEDNKRGQIATFEIIPELRTDALLLWQDLGLQHRIESYLVDAQRFDASGRVIDFLFLDSEPQLRFDEFRKFWPQVRPGGVIMIHDLHPNMGWNGVESHGVMSWPYGDFRPKLGPYMQHLDVQTMSFPTPRGLSLFQKRAPGFLFTDHTLGQF